MVTAKHTYLPFSKEAPLQRAIIAIARAFSTFAIATISCLSDRAASGVNRLFLSLREVRGWQYQAELTKRRAVKRPRSRYSCEGPMLLAVLRVRGHYLSLIHI